MFDHFKRFFFTGSLSRTACRKEFFNAKKYMFNVIRLPTKFSRTIKRFSQKEKSELLDMLINIWDWETINIPDTLVWDTVWLIYGEWMNMESKNGNKPKSSLIKYSSESVAQVNPSKSTPRVEESRVKENRVDIVVSSEIIETKVSTNNLQELIKDTFDSSFIENLNDKYKLSKEDFNEQCSLFYNHWSETSPNWKKQRWQKEKTFDPKLRFYKWLSNNKKWTKPTKYEDHENIESILW